MSLSDSEEFKRDSGQDSAEGWGFLCLCGVLVLVCVICVFPLKLQDSKMPVLNGKLQSHKCHLCSLSPKRCAYCGRGCWKPSAVYVL